MLSCFSHIQLFVTPWTVAHKSPLSMGFSRQEYWSGLPFPTPGDLPNSGIKPRSPASQVSSLLSEPPGNLLKLYSKQLAAAATAAATAAKSLQSCQTLCDPILGILQARTLEWVAISFSSA